MARYDFAEMAASATFEHLPEVVVARTSRGSTAVTMLMLLPVLFFGVAPVVLIAFAAFANSSAIDILTTKPLAAIQSLVGLVIWTALFIVPLRRIISRLGSERTVHLDGTTVDVTDVSLLGKRHWSVPLADYSGIAHHVRASLSVLRHELILVHPDPARNVLIAIADRIPQSTIDRAKTLLGLPEVPARSLYGRAPAAMAPAILEPARS
jgi:hypothetical protein